jgi:hypothetical protein
MLVTYGEGWIAQISFSLTVASCVLAAPGCAWAAGTLLALAAQAQVDC